MNLLQRGYGGRGRRPLLCGPVRKDGAPPGRADAVARTSISWHGHPSSDTQPERVFAPVWTRVCHLAWPRSSEKSRTRSHPDAAVAVTATSSLREPGDGRGPGRCAVVLQNWSRTSPTGAVTAPRLVWPHFTSRTIKCP